jgi:hypothetical protein
MVTVVGDGALDLGAHFASERVQPERGSDRRMCVDPSGWAMRMPIQLPPGA